MKKLWLDLELCGDIDDAITLLWALEHNMNVKAISLLNPSEEELSFVRYWLNNFNKDIALFTHYDKKVKSKNTTHPIIKEYQETKYPVLSLDEITDTDRYIIFGGGAYTIPNILRTKGFYHFVLQGGYAGSNVCKKTILEKFRNISECASWNPNMDKNSTNELLNNYCFIDFISKDICHDSGIDIEFVNTMKDGITKDLLIKYFDGYKGFKNMHDVVALLYILDNSLCSMEKVTMTINKHKWSSKKNEFSKKRISVNWDKNKFLNLLKGN